MRQLGIACITVDFDGGGDSRQIEAVTTLDTAGAVQDLPAAELSIMVFDGWGKDPLTEATVPLQDLIESMTFAVIGLNHAGWENNDGAYGQVAFDAQTNEIRHDHHERYTDYNSYSHTLGGESDGA
jgi:hypothetical protein